VESNSIVALGHERYRIDLSKKELKILALCYLCSATLYCKVSILLFQSFLWNARLTRVHI